ncbi:MAG: ATP-dependent helicase [Myxococcales bacterium]|nr:ATP-dependent helicase [Myxococcales bacterium]
MKRYQLRTPSAEKIREQMRRELSEEQQAVVFAEGGPLLVIAGAGSGKTRALTYRVARLVHEGVPVDRILLCTFTNKAAREMVTRVQALLDRSIDSMWAGTFHHIANKILRRHAGRLGFGSNFTILDREDSTRLIDQVIEECSFSEEEIRFPNGRALCDLFGLCISTERSLDSIIEKHQPRFEPITGELREVFAHYQERKQLLNAMDFDDLLLFWLQLLDQHEEVRREYAQHFLHVLVDEFQDTNPIQARIIERMASSHHNLTVVGDDAQSIYSFRGAEARHILDFPNQYPEAKVCYLQQNYRSVPEILHLSNRVIAHNTYQFEKELQAIRNAGEMPVVVSCRDARQESAFIAQHIKELHEEGVPYDRMAILYRIHSHSLETQIALQRAGIPFALRSGIRFFEQAHVKDVVAFLRILNNAQDLLSWQRLLPIFKGVGAASVKKISQRLEEYSFDLHALGDEAWCKKLPKAARNALAWLLRLLDEARELQREQKPNEIIRLFYEQEYEDYLQNAFDNAQRRSEDIVQLATYAYSYPDLQTFLDELVLFGETDPNQQENAEEQAPVVLSTIHQAKGLEWDVVFVLNLVEGAFPFFRAVEEGNDEEERRLFYVACTRARDQLYLLFRQESPSRGRWGSSRPSRFLWDILHEPGRYEETGRYIEEWLQEAEDSDLVDVWVLDE